MTLRTAMAAEPTDADFESFRALVREQSGIHLGDSQRALLYGRLARRVRELGLSSFTEYYRRAAEDGVELLTLLDRIVTNETRFFREPHHFAYLTGHVVPAFVVDANLGLRAKRVRAWSAGCSTGEEAYSIAMTLIDQLPAGWTIDVLATDLSLRALDVARRATWPIARAAEIPEAALKRHMLRGIGPQSGSFRASPGLRGIVRVDRLNLNDEASPDGAFDLIFCRNVLMYFHPSRRQAALDRILAVLVAGGHLFVGHAETAHGQSDLRNVSPTIYERLATDATGARRRRI
jgi:chemotaxis protein methyltransferase CheR